MPVPPGTPLPKPGTSSLGAGPKEEKAVKETRKMFKQIGRVASKIKGVPGAIGAIGSGIESVMPFLETLAPLFQAFEPILTITNAMFAAFAGALTVELMPALTPLFTAMIGMIPIFTELGTIVGSLIAGFLSPLINIFSMLIPQITGVIIAFLQSESFLAVIDALLLSFVSLGSVLANFIEVGLYALVDVLLITIPLFVNLLLFLSETDGLLVLITVAISAFGVGIGLLIQPIIVIIGIVTVLTTVFGVIATIIDTIVLPAIGSFIMGIAIMIDAITFGMAGAVNYINGLMGTLPGAMETPLPTGEGRLSSKFGAEELLMLQGGTDRVTRSGAFGLHAGEAVTSSSEVELQTSLLEEIRDLQREQLSEIRWRTR